MDFNIVTLKKRMRREGMLEPVLALESIMAAFPAANYYLVGGAVRDLMFHEIHDEFFTFKDLDFEIHKVLPLDFVKEYERLENPRLRLEVVVESFGVYKLTYLTPGKQPSTIDISFPRTETCLGGGHADFEIQVNPFLGVREAMRSRDFSMNAIYVDMRTGEVLDFYGGIDDVSHQRIDSVDIQTFKEDPLRVLRAAAFASRFNLKLSKGLIQVCRTMSLSDLSKERIANEFLKIDEKGLMVPFMEKLAQLNPMFFYEWFGLERYAYNHGKHLVKIVAEMEGDRQENFIRLINNKKFEHYVKLSQEMSAEAFPAMKIFHICKSNWISEKEHFYEQLLEDFDISEGEVDTYKLLFPLRIPTNLEIMEIVGPGPHMKEYERKAHYLAMVCNSRKAEILKMFKEEVSGR